MFDAKEFFKLAGVAPPSNTSLRSWRNLHGFTQVQAARAAGIRQSAWSALELRNARRFNWSDVCAVAATLAVTPEEIIPLSLCHPYSRITRMNRGEFLSQFDDQALALSAPDETVANQDQVEFLLACLNERERMIIVRRFCLYGTKWHTLQACGARFGLTRERARMIETEAMNKMRMLAERCET